MKPGTIFAGTILVSLPESGVALVSTAEGTQGADELYIAHLPVSDSSDGAVQQNNLCDGSAVICMVDGSRDDRAYIIAPANYAIGDLHDSLSGRAFYQVDDYAEATNKTFQQLVDNLSKGDFKCYAHGADMNAIPGDYDVTDITGNAGLHVGRMLVQLRGSPAAFIDLSNVTNAIRIIAPTIESHTPLAVSIDSKDLDVHDIAITDSEAFGLKEGSPFVVKRDIPDFEDESAIPLYRIQNISGPAADGTEHIVVGFPDSDEHYCTTEPPILAKQRVSLSGALSNASANSILSVKSPAIEAIMQVWYDKDRSKEDQDEILKPYTLKEQEEEEQEATSIDDTAVNKLIDKLFSDDYVGLLLQKMSERGLAVSTENGTLASRITATDKTGPSRLQAYELPDSIELTDPVSGKKTLYYASTSFISQEPDGSILICDGYGSEIRMSRGNIYISPALDLFLRPGRDLSAMVPHYLSFNSQDHITINSSKSVYLRAVDDMKLAAAAAEDSSGVLTLENCSSNKNATDGIVIRSRAGVAMTGHDIYIGRTKWDSKVQNRVEETDQGSIVIDSGKNGSLYTKCSEFLVDSVQAVIVANETGLRVSNDIIGLYTKGVEITGNVVIAGKKVPEVVSLYIDGQIQKRTLKGSDEDPDLQVDGDIGVDGDLLCNGSGQFNTQLAARTLASKDGQTYQVSSRYGDPFAAADFQKSDAHYGMGDAASGMLKNLASSIYQDYYTAVNSFSFPQYAVSLGIMPGMVWQANDKDKDIGTAWKEEAVISVMGSTTMCYPGLPVWSEAKVSYRKNVQESLLTGYLTNTQGETNA